MLQKTSLITTIACWKDSTRKKKHAYRNKIPMV